MRESELYFLAFYLVIQRLNGHEKFFIEIS